MGLPIAALQLREKSLEIKLSPGVPLNYDVRTGDPVGFADGFGGPWDVLVVQRPMTRSQVLGIKDAKAKGIRVVIEVDDDFHALHSLSPAWATTHPRVSEESNRKWLGEACKVADLVTVSTPALAARYAPHGRYVILPNYVPAAWLSVSSRPKYDNHKVVGWTGTVGTHQGDLKVTRGGVARAIEETKARFRVVGHSDLVRRDLDLREEPELVDWTSFESYPQEIARFDVGIAPLAATAFNRAKSAIKILEYAALGVPAVCSPLPEYERLSSLGIGILAKDRARDWKRAVSRLLSDPEYRTEVVAQGREAAGELTVEAHAHLWAEAWTAPSKVRHA